MLSPEPTTLPQGCDEWRTPGWLFRWCADRFGPFTLDGAARQTNAKCDRYCGPGSPLASDGAAFPWHSESVWCNPPYSDIGRFVEAATHARRAVLLVPANRTEQQWFGLACATCSEIIFLRPRVAYEDPLGAGRASPAFASVLLVWNYECVDSVRVTQALVGPDKELPL